MKINVTKSSMPDFEEYCEEIKGLWESCWLTNMGVKHRELQTKLEEYLKVEGVELLTNGHMALELSMKAMNLTGEVITTPFTFASTTHAIVRNGLTPVFCDINPIDFTIDVSKIEELITDKTSAIVPVHVYGNICDVEAISRIAEKYGLKVIYDAAHTFGAKYKGKGIGSFGDVSCFSFHATKVFHTIEGGAVCFRDKNIGEAIGRLKDFGILDEESVTEVGPNAKMNEFCAAMGLCNLRHVDREIQKRKRIVMRYRERLQGAPGIQVSPVQEKVESNYSYFPVIFDAEVFGMGRDMVKERLAEEGIGTRKYFYPLTNTFQCYKNEFDVKNTPIANRISQRVLTLPLYADLSLEIVDQICDIILSCKK